MSANCDTGCSENFCVVCHRPVDSSAIMSFEFYGDVTPVPSFVELIRTIKDEIDAARDAIPEYVAPPPGVRVKTILGEEQRRYLALCSEDSIVRRLVGHQDFGKISYRRKKVDILVCDSCRCDSRVVEDCVSHLPFTREGWVLGTEPTKEDVARTIDNAFKELIPSWSGFEDYKIRKKKRDRQDQAMKNLLGVGDPRRTGCMVPLVSALISILTLCCWAFF